MPVIAGEDALIGGLGAVRAADHQPPVPAVDPHRAAVAVVIGAGREVEQRAVAPGRVRAVVEAEHGQSDHLDRRIELRPDPQVPAVAREADDMSADPVLAAIDVEDDALAIGLQRVEIGWRRSRRGPRRRKREHQGGGKSLHSGRHDGYSCGARGSDPAYAKPTRRRKAWITGPCRPCRRGRCVVC
jgi:hypothetical protein